MKVRTYKELYKILHDNSDLIGKNVTYFGSNYPITGICYLIKYLKRHQLISWTEHVKVLNDFNKRKPTHLNKYKKFYNHPSFGIGSFWWDINEEGNKQRRNFIKTIYNELNK